MNKVRIYTTGWCPYCNAAKALLDDKGVSYEEIDVTDPALRMDMVRRANGRRTVPQIFIGATHVGGYDEIATLERRGEWIPTSVGRGKRDGETPTGEGQGIS